jgi:L-fucose isomerase-like protein
MKKLKIGFIPAHRELMGEAFAVEMREFYIKKLSSIKEMELIYPDENLTKKGLVRDLEDSKAIINFFSEKKIDGIILGALNYGDERSALTIVENFYNLPIFIFGTAEPEIPKDNFFRSASACGILPISFGLTRRNIKFTFGGIAKLEDKKFDIRLDSFLRVVSAYKKFNNARIGMIGSRQNDFEVCAFNEALMISRYKQKIVHFNLLDLKYEIESIPDSNPEIQLIIESILKSGSCSYDKKGLYKVAKLEYQILKYAREFDLDAFTIQCWTSMQKFIGVTPCLTNGRITKTGYPVACEGDVNNALAMLIQRSLTFGETTPMILDILTIHPEIDNLVLAWHCGNASVDNKESSEIAKIMPQCPWEGTFGKEAAAASMEFVLKPGTVTFNCLVEHNGQFKLSNITGKMVKRKDKIRGAWSWVEMKDRDKFYETIVYEGFTHHNSIIYGDLTLHVKELCKYLNIQCIEA